MWFIGVEVEQETSAPPPKKNPGSAPEDSYFKKLDFGAQSVQSLRPGTTKILNVFNYFMC